MAAFLDNVRFNPTAGGTTDWTYSSAVTGYQGPSAGGVANGTKYKYFAISADSTQWEIGEGAYNTSTGALARTTVLYNSSGTGTASGQSGAGTKISFSAAPQVAIVGLAEDLPSLTQQNAFSDTTASTSYSTGAMKITGGLGVGGDLYLGGNVNTQGSNPNVLLRVGLSGGAPQTSGTTDANQFLAAGNNNVHWRFGFYFDGTMWSQPSLASNYATNFGTYLCPNGGNIGIGLTPALAAPSGAPTSTLTVGGAIATRTPQTKTGNYSQQAADNSLIFNGTASTTLTLLAPSSYPGQWLLVKTIAAFNVISASSNVVPLAGGAAGTSILQGTAGKWAMLQSDGTNWVIMAGN